MRLAHGSSDRDCAPLHLSRVLDVTLRDTRQRPKLRLNRASVVADHDLERPEGRTAQVAAVSPSRADGRVRAAPALRDHHGHERQHDDRAVPPPCQTDGAQLVLELLRVALARQS